MLRKITRVTESGRESLRDPVAIEKLLVLKVNGEEVLNLYCSPAMIRELVTGLIMTEGIIEGEWCVDRMTIEYGDVISVDVPAEGRVMPRRAIRTSGCAGGITFQRNRSVSPAAGGPRITKEGLIELFGIFQEASGLHRMTGCVHGAAVATERHMIIHAEDIGRHNAVDKVLGYCLIENVPLEDKIMLVSGRLSSEMAEKCARWRIPIVASRTAATMKAIETADAAGITLVGFLRGRRFNVYCHADRIL